MPDLPGIQGFPACGCLWNMIVCGLRVYRVQGSPKGPSINMVGSWQQSWAPKVLYIYTILLLGPLGEKGQRS